MDEKTLYLLVFNTITNVLVIIIFGYKTYFSKFKFSWNETFWMKKKYGFTLWYWYSKYAARGLFTITFRSREKAEEGEYKKYLKKKKATA